MLGISSYGSKPQEVGEHLQLLLDYASEVVPKENYASTPIFLMATAGMRLLPETEQKAVLDETCKYIQNNYEFYMRDCESHIKVIPGELEGIYGWVAVNYLMGGFDTSIQKFNEGALTEGDQHHTFGFLDMGGASAQIAFEPEHHQKEEHFDDLARIYLHTLDGQKVEYDVFVTTFLGYGSNEARRRYLEERVRIAHSTNNGKNMLDEHRTLHLDDPCLPLNLNMTDSHSTSVPLRLHGTGNFNECIEYTIPLLNKDAECPTKPCLFNGVHTPHIDWSVNKFVGISEYWYSSHDILGLGGVYDFAEYEKKATEYCARDWSEIAEENKDLEPADLQHHQMQCFKSAWIVNVLHDGIEIPRIIDPNHNNASDDQQLLEQSIESIESKNWSPPFQSIDKINDIQVSWTLGAMVLHVANLIPLSDSPSLGGHNTDDEGPHSVADGVQLPEPSHENPLQNNDYDNNHVLDDAGNLLDTVWANTSFNTYTIMMIMVLCSLLFWCLYKRSGRKRRALEEARWEGPNGGLLGSSVPSSAAARTSSPYTLASSLATALSRSTLALRSMASRLLKGGRQASAVSVSSVEIDTLSELPSRDSISISIPHSGCSSSSPNGLAKLGPSSRSQSFIAMKYWSKKRYSGDSHSLFPPMEGGRLYPSDSHLPLRSSSSAVNLANRANSSTNLSEIDN